MRRIFLHGFTGGPTTFKGIAGPHDLTPTLAGHGPEPVFVETFNDEADRIARLIAGDDPLHVVGYSMGARLALALACRHPERVLRLTLIGVNAGISPEARPARRRWEASWADRILAEGVPAFTQAWGSIPLFASQTRAPRARLDAQQAQRLSHTAEGLAHAMVTCGLGSMPDLRGELSRLTGRVTLVVGGEDHKFRGLAESYTLPSGGRIVTVPHSGHNVVLEYPDALRAILDGEPV